MTTINYDELREILPDITLIDVRNHDEVSRHGRIPGSKSVPLPEFNEAFRMSNEEFNSKYSFSKPAPDATIITHCTAGMKAMKGANMLEAMGYKDVKYYSGSFNDWVQNGGEVDKE